MVELKFINVDARPKVSVVKVRKCDVEPIMAWYGSFYSGDRYRVEIDGVVVKKDQNGQLVKYQLTGQLPA